MSYQPLPALPIEFRLAIACCGWAFSGEDAAHVRELSGGVNWGAFLATCRRHRVQGLAWHALHKLDVPVPGPVRVALAGDARAISEHGLKAAREAARLADAFRAADIAMIFLKGLAVSKLAYGDPFLKMSSDIDILVQAHELAPAAALLVRLGCRLIEPADAAALLRWHSLRKDSVWRNGDGLIVELHGRVADQEQVLPAFGVESTTQRVSVASNFELTTFADEELFAYLCVHGTAHNWSRLKWLADLGAMLGRRTPDEIAQLYDAARACSVGRCAAVALLLCRRLLGLALPERLVRALEQDRVARALVQNALAGLAYRKGTFELRPYTWPWVRMMMAQFFVGSGGAHGLHQLRTVWNSPGDRAQVALPRGFEFGYHLLRVPLWLGRVSRRTWAALGRSSLS